VYHVGSFYSVLSGTDLIDFCWHRDILLVGLRAHCFEDVGLFHGFRVVTESVTRQVIRLRRLRFGSAYINLASPV